MLRPPRWGLWDVVIGMVGAIAFGLIVGAAFLLTDAPFVTAALLVRLDPLAADGPPESQGSGEGRRGTVEPGPDARAASALADADDGE